MDYDPNLEFGIKNPADITKVKRALIIVFSYKYQIELNP